MHMTLSAHRVEAFPLHFRAGSGEVDDTQPGMPGLQELRTRGAAEGALHDLLSTPFPCLVCIVRPSGSGGIVPPVRRTSEFPGSLPVTWRLQANSESCNTVQIYLNL